MKGTTIRSELPLLERMECAAAGLPDLRINEAGEGFIYRCPHCDREVYSERETRQQIIADPSCCYCRAESRGLPFSEWRRLPMEERLATRPPGEFRSTRNREKEESR